MNKITSPQFCRACACEIKDDACKIENNPAKPELPQLLRRYVPEFSVKIEDACLCSDCVSMLDIYHKFKRKCLGTEGDLRLHKRKHPEVGKVDLNEVFGPKKPKTNPTADVELSSDTATQLSQTIATTAKKKQGNNAICNKNFSVEPATITIEVIEKTVQHTSFQINTTSRKTNYVCIFCNNRRFSCEKALLLHRKLFHGFKRYECNSCGRFFSSKQLHDSHMLYHQYPEASRFTCQQCYFVYESQGALTKHIFSKHASKDKHKAFACEVCKMRFVEKHSLTQHMRKHTCEKQYECPLCEFACAYVSSLHSHLRTVHNVQMTRTYDENRGNYNVRDG